MQFVQWLRSVALVEAGLFALLAQHAHVNSQDWPWLPWPVAWAPFLSLVIVWAQPVARSEWGLALAVGVPIGIVGILAVSCRPGWYYFPGRLPGVLLGGLCCWLSVAEVVFFRRPNARGQKKLPTAEVARPDSGVVCSQV